MSNWWIECGDSAGLLKLIPDNSVNLIATDPPYYRVKDCDWDKQWKTANEFLGWLRSILAEFQRILKPNGSLYLFASPQMSARVECLVGELFSVLNRIVWNKTEHRARHKGACKEALRSFFSASESIIFAEHFGADSAAKGETGYAQKCDKLRGFVFEPLRGWLRNAVKLAGLSTKDVNRAVGSSPTGGGMASHYIGKTNQWELPTSEHYAAIKALAPSCFDRSYEDLRQQYEDLRQQYEDLRRPFKVTSDVPYTDVWDFPTVQFYKGKHPCEKPLALMEHVITASSRPGDVVLDPFCGSGATGVAARKLGRQFVGIERDAKWVEISRARVGLTTSCSTNQRPQRTINNKNSGIGPVAMSLFD